MEIKTRTKVRVNKILEIKARVEDSRVKGVVSKDKVEIRTKMVMEHNRVKLAVLRVSKVIRVVLKEDHSRVTRDSRHKTAVSREVNKVLAQIRTEDKTVDSRV